jgi:hypothetical protein
MPIWPPRSKGRRTSWRGSEATYTVTVVNTAHPTRRTSPSPTRCRPTSPSSRFRRRSDVLGGRVADHVHYARLAAGSSLVVNVKVGREHRRGGQHQQTRERGRRHARSRSWQQRGHGTTPVTQAALPRPDEDHPRRAPSPPAPRSRTRSRSPTPVPRTPPPSPSTTSCPPGCSCCPAASPPGRRHLHRQRRSHPRDVQLCHHPVGQSRVITLDDPRARQRPRGLHRHEHGDRFTSATADPDPSAHTASATTPVTTVADVVILKTPLDVGVDAGDQHGYFAGRDQQRALGGPLGDDSPTRCPPHGVRVRPPHQRQLWPEARAPCRVRSATSIPARWSPSS